MVPRGTVGYRRVYDCIMYNGEADALAIRLHELARVVDYFVIVESTVTFSNRPREISYDPANARFAPFASRIRHVIVDDMPPTEDPWVREAWQRNAVLAGAADAEPDDLLILSDADEIPRGTIITEIIADRDNDIFGLRLDLYYFFVNYFNSGGPESSYIWNNVATKRRLETISPHDLRTSVRQGLLPARIFDKAGWHFSYLTSEAGVKRKIASFSHQEFNTKEFLDQIDIARTVAGRCDFYGRAGYRWDVIDDDEHLPEWLRLQKMSFTHLFWSDDAPKEQNLLAHHTTSSEAYFPDHSLATVRRSDAQR